MSKYCSDRPLSLASAQAGDKLSELVKHPGEVDVVRFCAAIRNFHRFHYDQAFTGKQGIETIIVPGFMIGNWCIEAVTRAFEPGVEIGRLKFRNTAMAPVGRDYLVTGAVTAAGNGDQPTVECSLEVRSRDTGEVVTTAIVGIRPVSKR